MRNLNASKKYPVYQVKTIIIIIIIIIIIVVVVERIIETLILDILAQKSGTRLKSSKKALSFRCLPSLSFFSLRGFPPLFFYL